MTITLANEQVSILTRLVALGRYASREDALADAVRRLDVEEAERSLPVAPLTREQLNEVYAPDEQRESVERALAGQAVPEV